MPEDEELSGPLLVEDLRCSSDNSSSEESVSEEEGASEEEESVLEEESVSEEEGASESVLEEESASGSLRGRSVSKIERSCRRKHLCGEISAKESDSAEKRFYR